MAEKVKQTGNTVTDGDIVAGNKNVILPPRKSRLTHLFEKLQEQYSQDIKTSEISDDLKRFHDSRDIIGLEQKLIDGNRQHLLEDATWLKQEYYKKLTKFQFFEPAQEIHAYIMGIVLEKFRNLIYPMINSGQSELEISRCISNEIIGPILTVIQSEGCEDIMGLSATDIDGMIYFLTGKCHIKWIKNDSISSGI